MDYYQVGHWSVTPVTSGASTAVLSSTALRDHLRITATSEDGLLAEKLAVAQRRIEGRTSRRYFRAQFDLTIDKFPCDDSPIRLPIIPLVSVDAIWSYDSEGSSSQFSSSGYFVDAASEPGRVCLHSGVTWPSGTRDQVAGVIRFTAGYSTGNLAAIPTPLIEGAQKFGADLYENREAVSLGNSVNEPLPIGVEQVIEEYLLPEFG